MRFKVGDRVKVSRFNRQDVNFFATLSYTCISSTMYRLIDCSDCNIENALVWKQHIDNFREDKEDYYIPAGEYTPVLRWSDGSPSDGEIYKSEEENKRTINDLNINAYETKLVTEDEEDTEEPVIQHTEPLDKGEIIAQSIIDNRDGSSFTSAHDMIIWLNEIEEMHGEGISVKGWYLIFDHIKESIAPAFFGKE